MKLSRPLLLLALAAILPLVLLSAALGALALRQQQQAMQQDAMARVDLAAALLDRDLSSQVSLLAALVQSPQFDGEIDKEAASNFLERTRLTRPLWRALVLTDLQGYRLASSPSAGNYPQRIVELASHARAVATGRMTIGQVAMRPTGGLAFNIRMPVIRDGKVRYVLSAAITPAGVQSLLLTRPLPKGWVVWVVDGTGRLVVRNDPPEGLLGNVVTSDTLRARASRQGGLYVLHSARLGPMEVAYKVLPEYGWSVHAGIPVSVFQAPAMRSSWLMAGAAVVSLLLAGVFLLLLARELRRRRREDAAAEEARRMETLGRMTGGVAHDFNNLLMVVQGNAELLRRRTHEPERIEPLAEAILVAARRGHGLTRQLLAFARRSTYDAVDFRLQDRTRTLGELVRRSLPNEVLVSVATPPDTWAVHADPDALEIALLNLAVNARDAMPEGGQLTITAANVSLPAGRDRNPDLTGDFVTLTVRDTGIGIAEEHIGHIFEPFYTTKPTGRGTGLGLSQVYGFARQSGGAITVASRPGEGAAFTLYLPRAATEPAAAPQPGAVAPASAETGRLLLVESDPAVARTLEAMLAACGYEVAWAPDGAAALALVLAEGAEFDLLLCDLIVGGAPTGRDLAARLRRACPGLAVVLMSGDSEAVGEGVLSKPFGPEEALAALRAARARTPARTAARAMGA